MKKLFFALFFTATLMANAQLCTPDTTIKVPGFYPSQLADGAVGTPYNQTVMILSFKDTSAVVGGSKQKVTIDSLKLTKVIGLPTGMGYVCYEPRCIYLPSAVRCIKLNGTPNQAGLFPLKFAVTAYAKLNGFFPVAQPDTIKNFSLLITGTSDVATIQSMDQLAVFPNPVKDVLHVAHRAPNTEVKSPSHKTNHTQDNDGRQFCFLLGDFNVKLSHYSLIQIRLTPATLTA